MKSKVVLCIAGALLFSACHGNPNYNPMKTHHTADGFRNNYPHPGKQSFWKWQWQRWTRGVAADPKEGYNFPLLKPDTAFLESNRSEPTLTWIGHATFLLQLGGVNVLTDPHLTERASPLSFAGPKRHVGPSLDFGTVQRLNAQEGGPPMFFVPLALKGWFHEQGIDSVTELDWWDSRDHMGLKLHLVPVQHWSARTPWDTNKSLWGSWVIEHPQMRFLFGGDFGYSQDLADIGKRFGRIDLAALPIGAYEPRWFMKVMHVNAEEAVRAHRDLNARYSVAMHWGTFRLTDERLDEPPVKLAEALAGAGIPSERFFVMKHGETRKLDYIVAASAHEAEPPRRAAAR